MLEVVSLCTSVNSSHLWFFFCHDWSASGGQTVVLSLARDTGICQRVRGGLDEKMHLKSCKEEGLLEKCNPDLE